MAQQHDTNRKKFPVIRNLAIIVLKFILCTALWYSFDLFTAFYGRFDLIERISNAVYSFLVANIFVSLVYNIVVLIYLRRIRDREEVRGNFVLGINRIAGVLNTVLAVITMMLIFNIDPKEFITSITIVAMAIALLFKDYITNMISGLLIMFSDQLTIGDRVKLGEHEGKVHDITLANIVLKNEDDDLVLVPNNLFFTAALVNHSSPNSRKVSLEFELPVQVVSNRIKLENRLKKILADQPDAVNMQSFRLKILKLQKDLVRFKVQFVLNKRNRQQQDELKKMVYDEVLVLYAEQETVRSS